jgi:hypothetical protein
MSDSTFKTPILVNPSDTRIPIPAVPPITTPEFLTLLNWMNTAAVQTNLGIPTQTFTTFTNLDLTVPSVQLVHAEAFAPLAIDIAGESTGFNTCRLDFDPPGILDTTFLPRLIVTCASESLVNCGTPSPAVHVKVQARVILRYTYTDPCTHTVYYNYVAQNVTLIDKDIATFFLFSDGTTVVNNTPLVANPLFSALKYALREIDGSSITINATCAFSDFTPPALPTQVLITGNIVDKLWKMENLYLIGAHPYDSDVDYLGTNYTAGKTTLTVSNSFGDPQAVGSCN